MRNRARLLAFGYIARTGYLLSALLISIRPEGVRTPQPDAGIIA